MTPPVGMKVTSPYGAAMDLMYLRPPAASAGKNLTDFRPRESASSMSEGFAVPGQTGTPICWQYLTVVGLRPGETMNFAPAATARSTCSVVSTVPAPTIISGNASAIALIASAAHGVRKVTSAAGRPPSIRALAIGMASAASLIAMTGTIPILESSFITSMGKTSSYPLMSCALRGRLPAMKRDVVLFIRRGRKLFLPAGAQTAIWFRRHLTKSSRIGAKMSSSVPAFTQAQPCTLPPSTTMESPGSILRVSPSM